MAVCWAICFWLMEVFRNFRRPTAMWFWTVLLCWRAPAISVCELARALPSLQPLHYPKPVIFYSCGRFAMLDAYWLPRGTQGINEKFCSQPNPRIPWIINGTWGSLGNWIANLVITWDVSAAELCLCLPLNVQTNEKNYWLWVLFIYLSLYKFLNLMDVHPLWVSL